MAEEAVLAALRLDDAGRHLLLAGDPVAPGEVLAARSAPMVDIAVCLLDVRERAQRERSAAAATPRSCSDATSRSRTGCGAMPATHGTCHTC
jgi:hypothetical protein